ncbi:formate dehydrogenase subunit gamma [Microvirga arabica]|uniref:formate dehydrogenase subunit gamma n=1 Tax=Microvirga arabica TaxID=1128671 RepID=UPI00193A16F8|nr:formate dehydrogenase subunit gamma [Microvirga arabica]MBM1171511.1 formate dehydrogenase subunit gamma [Microvirga arabica]
MTTYIQWNNDRAREIIAAHALFDGAALPILHALQFEFGFIHEEAIPLIADALNLSRAEVHGIVTFYHDFRRDPAGRHVLKLCRAEACQSMNGTGVAQDLLATLGISWGETTPDGSLTVEGVYCLGLCACAPSALYDGEPIGRLTLDTLADVVREARAP